MDQLSAEPQSSGRRKRSRAAPASARSSAVRSRSPQPSSKLHQATGSAPPVHFRCNFEVQFCIEQSSISLAALKQSLLTMGECLAVEGDANFVHVRVRVQDPGAPLSYAVQVGYVTDVRIENLDSPAYGREHGSTSAPSPAAELREEVALVAAVAGAGFADTLRALGAHVIIDAGAAANPDAAALAAALRILPQRRILVLPNDSDVLLAAQQAAEIVMAETPARKVIVAATKTMPQVMAAAPAAVAAGNDLAAAVAQIHDHCLQIDSGAVTQAIRGAEFDGIAVEVGDYIGLHDGRLVTRSSNLDDVVLALLEQMAADESRIITIYYGDFIAAEAAKDLQEAVRSRYADQTVTLAYGGQAHYHYVLATE